jgi:hypothetical protein
MYHPTQQSDEGHHDWTGWRGAAALFVVMAVVAAGHAVAKAASPWSSPSTACTPRAKVVLGPGLHSGRFTGKDLLGKASTGRSTC